MSDTKTLQTIFKAVDKFTPTVKNIVTTGKQATKEVNNLQNAINRDVSASSYEKASSQIELSFKKSSEQSIRSIENIESAIEKGFNDASSAISEVTKQNIDFQHKLEESSNRIQALEKELESLKKQTDDNSEGFEGLSQWADLAKKALGGVVAFFGVSAIASAINSDMRAINQFQAMTGTSTEQMKQYRAEIRALYSDGMGESLDDVASSMALIKANTGLVGEELSKTTNNALLLRDTFDFDVSESTRAVKMMMDQFNLSTEQSYNLIAQGAQNGLNKNDDLLDTINEYSVHFKQLGFSAEDMFNMLANGAKSGTFSVDKLGDTIKEFGIRAIDGSDTTVTAFKTIGLNADAMAKKFSKGGSDAKEAFTETINALKNMKDPIEQNTAGVNLFGTMWEDLGAKGVFAISNLNGTINQTSDALKQINDVKYEDLGSTFTSLGRSAMTSFTDGLNSNSKELVTSIKEAEKEILPITADAGEAVNGIIKTTAGTIKFATQNANGLKTALSGVLGTIIAYKTTNGISNITKGLGTFLTETSILPSVSNKAGGALTSVASGISKIALPASLAVGGIAAISMGFKAYYDWSTKKSLDKHFGNIALSMAEIEQAADKIVTGGNLSKFKTSLDEFKKLDTINDSIESTVSNIEKYNWKVEMGFKLSVEDNEDYKKNIDNYISEVQDYITQKHYTATMSASMIFGDSAESEELTQSLNNFYTSQEQELAQCGKELQEVVNDAFEDGLLDFKEQEKIQELQKKISDIKKGLEEDKFDATLERLGSDYAGGNELTADTFKNLQEEVSNSLETVKEANKEAYEETIVGIKKVYANNPQKQQQFLKEAEINYKTNDADYESKGVIFEANAIHNAHKDEIDNGYVSYNNGLKNRNFGTSIGTAIKSAGGDVKTAYENLNTLIENETQNMEASWVSMSGSNKRAISELYNSLKPEQSQLTEVASACIESGKQIPTNVSKGILDATAVGAVTGNVDALYIRTAYNMTQQNPDYANTILKAKESGIDIPDSILLGIELAKPGAISSASKAGTETVDAAKSGVESAKTELNTSAYNTGQSMIINFLNGVDGYYGQVQSRVNALMTMVQNALNAGYQLSQISVHDLPAGTQGPIGVTFNALGGIYNKPTLTWVAEAGDSEAIIPLNDTQRAFDLWQEAGQAIGVARGFSNNEYTATAFTENQPPMNVDPGSINMTEKTMVLKIEGGGEINIPKTLNKQDVLNLLIENIKPVLINMIQQEKFEEGDGLYDT